MAVQDPVETEVGSLEAAWRSLTDDEQTWLGRDTFRQAAQLIAEGHRERDLYRVLWGVRACDIRGIRRELTRRLKVVMNRPQVALYVERIKDPMLPPPLARRRRGHRPSLGEIDGALRAASTSR